ncbi:GNAT family N-acetyltransferase [Methylobacterium sp. Leaf466]|uniref:GNAT family N-acetyltransferase n=1 Tax=Methylobacterium sp. Leaf466 TaxID=1736386 RepID=UPI0006FEE79A|nr:GNAT family N-acetyltransferase [Methylobacterium sp. Leaf466]KQT78906.1 hemolysin [Methylobacterium sp. Leaf466]
MVPNFARDASAAWLNGWEAHVHAPLARFRQKRVDAGLAAFPGLGFLPPGGVPIKFKPRLKRPLAAPGLDPSLGRIGNLEVRLATSVPDIRRAQRLRYRVFYEEMSAIPTGMTLLARRDIDDYDTVCDHLLVIDHAATEAKPFRKPRPKVVGTYRLLRQDAADRNFGFYTAGEYDIAPLLAANPGKRFLELGRSCVLKPYRTKRTVELLWAGIWAYVQHHRIDAMLGCASLEGTDPDRLAVPLSFLHHHARAPDAWRARALPGRYVAMDRLAREAIDPKAALQALPPLIKGYLRVGATFGDGAVVDHQFGTTDVFVVLPVSAIAARYIDHFGPAANRRAA